MIAAYRVLRLTIWINGILQLSSLLVSYGIYAEWIDNVEFASHALVSGMSLSISMAFFSVVLLLALPSLYPSPAKLSRSYLIAALMEAVLPILFILTVAVLSEL